MMDVPNPISTGSCSVSFSCSLVGIHENLPLNLTEIHTAGGYLEHCHKERWNQESLSHQPYRTWALKTHWTWGGTFNPSLLTCS